MATASRGGKPAPAVHNRSKESITDLNSDSDVDIPLAKRGKNRDDRPDAQRKGEYGAVSKIESILDALRFTNPIEREQGGSILHSLQERGLKLDLDACISRIASPVCGQTLTLAVGVHSSVLATPGEEDMLGVVQASSSSPVSIH